MKRLTAALATALLSTSAFAFEITGTEGTVLEATEIATFDQPWAMDFLPDGSMLVTMKPGSLFHVTPDGTKKSVGNMFKPTVGGQGGLGDVVVGPNFAEDDKIYLSYVESLDQGATRGAAVVEARLDMSGDAPKLEDITKLWEQEPHLPGKGHFSHRIAFGPAGTEHEGFMFITSGDRQKQTPAQDMTVNLGKIIRLNMDGSVPADNPYVSEGGIAEQFWSVGHRNLLGIDFDAEGQLWTQEMGPRHGDELNRIEPGKNYGWPEVSDGDNYSGVPIPDHGTDPSFAAPAISWVPAISPAGLVIYKGDMFADWKGNAFLGGLSSQALIRVAIADDGKAVEAERYAWGKRVREVEEGPDGAIYVLEDKDGAKLLKLEPKG